MKKILCFFALCLCCSIGFAETKTIHVIVALCDNKYQGIVPVPASLGNGQNPNDNLYWGAMYGVKTFLKKQPEWILVASEKKNKENILERIVFKNKDKDIYVVADAYDGQFINKAVQDLFEYAVGNKNSTLTAGDKKINIAGGADMLVYIGHDAFMDNAIITAAAHTSEQKQLAVFACKSKQFFSPSIAAAKAKPLILTTGLMAPEAYTLHALINAWADNKTPAQTHEAVAQAYSKYQNCTIKAAKRLFYTEAI